jgi:hypothetical protein
MFQCLELALFCRFHLFLDMDKSNRQNEYHQYCSVLQCQQ